MTDGDADFAEFEVGGTITTGVRLFHMTCEQWFAERSSRELFPTVAVLMAACRDHRCEEVQ